MSDELKDLLIGFRAKNLDAMYSTNAVLEELAMRAVENAKNSESCCKQKRISPQLSCTISEVDRDALNLIALYASQKIGEPVTISAVIRSLIHLGLKYIEELDFND